MSPRIIMLTFILFILSSNQFWNYKYWKTSSNLRKKNHENSDSYLWNWWNKTSKTKHYLESNVNAPFLKKDMPNDLLLANTDVIEYSMEHIFNQSRNTNVDSYVRDVVASYIYEKFARYGLVAAIHSFSHARPKLEEQGKVSTLRPLKLFLGRLYSIYC